MGANYYWGLIRNNNFNYYSGLAHVLHVERFCIRTYTLYVVLYLLSCSALLSSLWLSRVCVCVCVCVSLCVCVCLFVYSFLPPRASTPRNTGAYVGSIGKNGTSNFTNASEWAWHVESRAWYAEVTGYTATTVHVHFGPLLACSNFTSAGRVSTKYKATLSPSLLARS